MKILIQTNSKKRPNGQINAKDYPFWKELLPMLSAHEIIQIGQLDEEKITPDFRKLSFPEVDKLVQEVDLCLCIDSFLQHLAWYHNKKAVVLWGKSDPLIFGHKENINLLKSRNNLRPDQFGMWNDVEHNPNDFVDALTVGQTVLSVL